MNISNSRSPARNRGFSSFGIDFDEKPVNFIDQYAKETDETNKIQNQGVKKQSAIPIDGYPGNQRDFTQLNSIISFGKPT